MEKPEEKEEKKDEGDMPTVRITFIDKVSSGRFDLSFTTNCQISDVLDAIQFSQKFKRDRIRLFFNCKELDEHAYLTSYGIEKAEIKHVYMVGVGNFS